MLLSSGLDPAETVVDLPPLHRASILARLRCRPTNVVRCRQRRRQAGIAVLLLRPTPDPARSARKLLAPPTRILFFILLYILYACTYNMYRHICYT